MGKVSAIFVLLLMINIIGYIIMTGMVEQGISEGNPFVTENALLTKFYTPKELADNSTVYVLDNTSGLYANVPQNTPSSFIEEGISFVDRIFILFGFVQVILGVILFPIAMLSFLGLPAALNMLVFLPLMTLYILGIIDLLTGGSS